MLEIFRETFMQTALLGGLISAVTCAYVGVFVILKRIVFMGIALSEIAALGVALGLFIGVNPVFFSFIFTFLGVIALWIPFTEKNISRESLIGFIYAFCIAVSVILVARNPLAEARGLNLVSGNLLYATWQDIRILGIAAFAILALHLIFFKEFIFVSFDRETAFTTGLKTNLVDFLLYLTVGVVISVSMKICGVIFVFGSLIIPAMTGLLSSRRIGKIFSASCLTSALCVLVGLICSYIWDLPSAPTIVALYGLPLILLAGIKPLTH
jgi:ABC-type Mn2+/Zn2+ transport system permease subunit